MTNPKDLPPDFLAKCMAVTAKRPRVVIDHILTHGYVTTEELKELYGYNHPPRAARDVRERGIPLETFRVTASDGRKIGAYRFGDPATARFSRLSGRTAFSKELKTELIRRNGSRCAIYLEEFDPRELQIDHRIPFEVVGDDGAVELLGKLDQLVVHLPDILDIHVGDDHGDDRVALQLAKHVEPATAAVAPQRVRGVGDILHLVEDESRDQHRPGDKASLADVGDAAIDDDAAV